MIRLLLVLCLLKVYGVQVAQLNICYKSDGHLMPDHSHKDVFDANLKSRVKRGWPSVLEGCSVKKSICTDKDAIDKLDREIQSLKSKYDNKYRQSKQEYLNLQKANTNNAYIAYYINKSVSNIENIARTAVAGFDLLQQEIPKVIKKYDSLQNVTSDKYLETILGQLETSLSSVRDMAKQQMNNQGIHIAAIVIVDQLVTRFIKTYDRVRAHVVEKLRADFKKDLLAMPVEHAEILLNKKHPRHNEIKNKYVSKAPKTRWNLKLTIKTFTTMLSNAKKFLVNKITAIKDWQNLGFWKGIKKSLEPTKNLLSSKVRNVRIFFKSTENRKYQIKQYKISWTRGLMMTLGIAMDALEFAYTHKNWNKVAGEMQKVRQQYEDYLTKLKQELNTLEGEEVKFSGAWVDLKKTFKGLSTYFKNIVQRANPSFNGVFGLTGQPISTQTLMFKTDFDKITTGTLIQTQDSVISFIKGINMKLTDVNDAFKARNILYKSVADMTKQKRSIKSIYESLKNTYDLRQLPVLKEYGKRLKERDVICSVAIIRIDINKYNFFPLPPFRPRCELSDADYENIKKTAIFQQRTEVMRQTVKKQIDVSAIFTIAQLLRAVQNAYTKIQMSLFGKSLTEKDIVCAIAEVFPRKQTYHYYPLSLFRPDCSAVTAYEFQQMKQKSSKRKSLESNVKGFLEMCDKNKYCLCLKDMTKDKEVNEADIIFVIKQLQPKRTQYCGTKGCGCVNLSK